LRATFFLILTIVLAHCEGHAQTAAGSDTSQAALRKAERSTRNDSTLSNAPKALNELWRRPQVARDGGDLYYSGEALRYYGSPNTVPELLEESGGGFPLVQSDEGYGRESYVMTSRTSEDLASMRMEGVLPMNSILNGTTLGNYFPPEAFSGIRINSMAEGAAIAGSDFASSDVSDLTLERFRAPVPYSRIHFTQDLARGNENFDGLFSINASRATNIALALHRHASGSPPSTLSLNFNPRTDLWNARGQMTITRYLGVLPTDSTMTEHKIDSILTTPEAKAKTLDFLLWGDYMTAFTGLNGGVQALDSSDIFDQVSAPVRDNNTFDHRIRADVLAELELPLLAEARTKLAGYFSYESRRILSPDSTFPAFIPDVATGTRAGATLEQPLVLSIGDFETSALLRGDAERIQKDSTFNFTHPLTETRLSATASDSLALRTALRISLFGFARTVESNLSMAGGPFSPKVLPSVGFSGSLGITDAISFHASYQYSKDRATLSPTPEATYTLQNIGGWFDAHFSLSRNDSLALHAGYLDRHEPEGIVYDVPNDTVRTAPRFSSNDLHSQSYTVALDAYLWKFHWSTSATYFPNTVPISPYTQTAALEGALPNRVFGFTGLYFENEGTEGNLRLTVGPRVRLINPVDPQLTYDPASDYYVYRGYAYSLFLDSALNRVPIASLTKPQVLFDFLLSAEVDRRAQVSMEFLNILGAPHYNVAIYPRDGFHWRLDVVWAFID